jgi:hypothetical protein
VEHCVAQLEDFRRSGGEDPRGSLEAMIHEAFEIQDGARLGRPVVAPNGLLAQEIVLPETTFADLLDEAGHDAAAFHILQSAGLQCVRTDCLDVQPRKFRDWFFRLISGRIPEIQRPKTWGNWRRNRLILGFISKCHRHGLSIYRNEASSRRASAIDAVAEAARKVKLRGVSSYETVRKIYQAANAARRG